MNINELIKKADEVGAYSFSSDQEEFDITFCIDLPEEFVSMPNDLGYGYYREVTVCGKKSNGGMNQGTYTLENIKSSIKADTHNISFCEDCLS